MVELLVHKRVRCFLVLTPGDSEVRGADDTSVPGLWRTTIARLGGVGGLFQAIVPTTVFAILAPIAGLFVATIAAFVVAVAIVLFQLAMGRSIRSSSIGLASVVVALVVACVAGDARDFFAIGIWSSLAQALVGLVSLLVRRPIAGYVWGWLLGHGTRWRNTPVALWAYGLVTLIGVVANGSRFAVQQSMYYADSLVGLATARVVMGWPLGIVMMLITYPLVRRAHTAVCAAG